MKREGAGRQRRHQQQVGGQDRVGLEPEEGPAHHRLREERLRVEQCMRMRVVDVAVEERRREKVVGAPPHDPDGLGRVAVVGKAVSGVQAERGQEQDGQGTVEQRPEGERGRPRGRRGTLIHQGSR